MFVKAFLAGLRAASNKACSAPDEAGAMQSALPRIRSVNPKRH